MKSIRIICIALVVLLALPTWATPMHTPAQLVAWRDSMELVYRRDVQQLDMTAMHAEIDAEPDSATKGVMMMLLAQCYETKGRYYAHRSDDFRRADELYATARKLYDSVWALRDAMVTEPAARWLGLMRDTTADAKDQCLLDVCYPVILDGLGTLDTWQKGARLNELAATFQQHGRRDAAVDVECLAIVENEMNNEARFMALSTLMGQNTDTHAAGRVLGALVPYLQGTVRDKVAYIEQALTRLRPDADTTAVHRQLAIWMEPRMKNIVLHDSLRAYRMVHIREAKLRLYKAELKDRYHYEVFSNLRPGELVAEEVLRPRYEGRDWRVEADTVLVTLHPEPGLYLLEVTSGTDTVKSSIRVSTVDLLIEEDEAMVKRLRYRVVSSRDGSKVHGARIQHRWNPQKKCPEIRAYRSKNDHTEWCEDENGFLTWNIYAIAERWEYAHEKRQERRTKPTATVLTDRAIYRPGQTVEVAVVYGHKRANGHIRIGARRRITMKVHHENKQVLDTTLRTDRMGRATFTYVIPEDAKPGSRYLLSLVHKNYNATTSVLVDNYRRPQATLTTRHDMMNDSCFVWATVRTAGGESAGDMQAICTLEGNTCMGTETAPGNMRFYVGNLRKLKAQKQSSIHPFIQVTLPSGETLTGSEYINLYKWPYRLNVAKKNLFTERDTAITITAKDGNDRPQRVPVSVELISDNSKFTLTGVTGKPMLLPRDLASGTYILRITSEADTLQEHIRVISPEHPAGNVDWLQIICSKTILTSEGADIYILSPWANLPVEVNVRYGKHTDNYQVVCRDNLGVLHLTPNARMEDDVQLEAYVVYNGEVYSAYAILFISKEEEGLSLGLKHFNDHTSPSSHERWTLTVSDDKGQPISGAAVVATMYDGALDQLATLRDWYIDTRIYRMGTIGWEYELMNSVWQLPNLSLRWDIPTPRTQALRWLGFSPNSRNNIRTRAQALASEVAGGQPGTNSSIVIRGLGSVGSTTYDATVTMATFGGSPVAGTAIEEVEYEVEYEVEEEIEIQAPQPKPQMPVWLRRDFREVALWSTTGVTNTKGELRMETTLPDQLSRWHLRVLAYDKHLRQGTLDTLMLVEQQLTLQPLWPRFVRPGDAVQMLGEARNRSNEALSLTTTLEVRSADSTQVLYHRSEDITLQPKETRRLVVPMPVADEWGDSVRIAWTISNDRLGDGEQQWVAIQPRETALMPDTMIRRSPEEILREQLKQMRLKDCHDALRVALALYVAKQEDRHDVQAELRLKRVVQKDGGIAWCPGMSSSPWVTMQVMDLLLREGRHPDVVQAAMVYLDKQREKSIRDADLTKVRCLSNDDIHYLALSAQVARTRSARTDSILMNMDAGLRNHVLALRSIRESAHTPLTIFGVSEIGCALQDNGTPLRATAAEHVLRLSLIRPEWGRYFKEESRNCRLQTQLSAIHLMDTVGRTQEADELRRWLTGQVWSRAWQNPVLIWQGLEQLTGHKAQVTADSVAFDNHGLVTMETEWDKLDSLHIGDETSVHVVLSAETELDLVRITIPLPACVEPVRPLSGYRYMGGLWVYVAQYDDRIELYLHRLGVGYRELSLPMRVLRPDTYAIPAATLTSDYWPEIYTHTTKAKFNLKIQL